MDAGGRYLWSVARRLRWTTVGAIGAGLAWQGAAIVSPLLVRHAVDAGIVHHHRSALWWACGGIAILGLAEAVAGGARHYFAIRNRALADAGVRDGIFRRALELDARYHDRVGAGELISRASNDAELVARVFDSIGHTVGYILTIFGVSIVLFVVDWRLALAVLLPLPLLSVGFGRYSRRYAERTKVNQEELGELTALAEETISGIRVVKGLGAGDALSARFRARSDRVVATSLAVADVDAVFLPALEVLPLVGVLVVLWYGAHRVLAGDITIGTFALFNVYLVLIVFPLRTIGQRVSTLQRGAAAARRVVDVLEAATTVVEPSAPRPFPDRSEVRFDDVRFAYADEWPILDGLSLTIPEGRSLALVGAPGPASRPSPRSSRASTTPTAAASRSAASTCASFASRATARRRASSSRRRFCSGTRSAATSASRSPTPTRRTSAAPRGSRAPRSSSSACRRATRRCSASAGSRSRADSGSGSRSRARSSPTRRC